MALLEIDDVTVSFGGTQALSHVTLEAHRNEITGIIGPNGAGKTTLCEVVAGGRTPDGGEVRLDGTELGGSSPTARARAGIGRTFQRLEPFGSLTVRETVELARSHRPAGRPGLLVDEIIDLLGLRTVADERCDHLPTGYGRLTEVARALAIGPRLLLLDEPASGLDDAETERLATVVRALAARGIGIVLVEHDIGLVMRVCDVIHVLDQGRVIASGAPAEIRNDARVRASYLGVPTERTVSPSRLQEAPMSIDTERRLETFDEKVAAITNTHDVSRRAARLGSCGMVAGIVLGIIAYLIGHRTGDPFVQNDAQVIAQIGICVTVASAAVYLRHGLALNAADSRRGSVGNSNRVSQ